MPTYTSIPAYVLALQRRRKALKKAQMSATKKSADYMIRIARRLAPRHTGETKAGIRKRRQKHGWSVESWVSGRFKQNMWANRTEPFKRPKMVWRGRKPTLYGSGVVTGSGRPVRWTGTPRFFDIAAIQTRKQFRGFVLDHTRKALRVK